MTEPSARPFPEEHPLRGDRERLDDILDLMWQEILKVLNQPPRARPKPGRLGFPELTLVGGVSARDILQEALLDLLRHLPEEDTRWEGLGVRIAQRKAMAALTESRRGRRRRGQPDIEVGSADIEDADGERLVEQLPDHMPSLTLEQAEEEVRLLRRQQALHRAAETLNDRDRQIVLRIMRGDTRVAIGQDLKLTPQRIGQINAQALIKLHRTLAADPPFRPPTTNPTEGGTPQWRMTLLRPLSRRFSIISRATRLRRRSTTSAPRTERGLRSSWL
jgi:RNA polymerase sigma factor (sigma-70 family)